MTSLTAKWRCFFVSPENLCLCINSHVVGPSSSSSFVEVAVSPHVPITHPYQDLPDLRPVSIDSLIKVSDISEFGYQQAHSRALRDFVENIRRGIYNHGSQLGQYYLERYPNIRPWTEYLLLIFDLPKKIPTRRGSSIQLLRDEFSRAVVFLALSIIDPDHITAKHVQSMTPDQVIAAVHDSLELELNGLYQDSRTSLLNIGVIRHVLTQIGGPQNAGQLSLIKHDCCESRIAGVFAKLVGAPEHANRQIRVSLDVLMRQLSRSRAFLGSTIDLRLITTLTRKLRLPLFLLITSLPNEWTAGFTTPAWRSIQSMNNDINSLCPALSQPQNSERVFVIWCYVMRKWTLEVQKRILSSADLIFWRAAGSLRDSASSSCQVALDLMALVCIQRLFPHRESFAKQNLVMALHNMFSTGSRENMLQPLNRLLASLHRVFIADDFAYRSVDVAGLISQVGFPKAILELEEAHADQYWSDRMMRSSTHDTAFGNLCWNIRSYPVSLAPIKEPRTDLIQDSEIKIEKEGGDTINSENAESEVLVIEREGSGESVIHVSLEEMEE